MVAARSESLLQRVARISSTYKEEGKKRAKESLLSSVSELAMCYMSTLRHTVSVDMSYGMESTSYLYEIMQSDFRFEYYKSIENGLLKNDIRLIKTTVAEKSYRHAKHGVVKYLDVYLEIKPAALTEKPTNDQPVSVKVAYDFTGSVFRIKQS